MGSETTMVWIVGVTSVLALLLVGVYFVGLLLPRQRTVTVSARIEAPPEVVWGHVTTTVVSSASHTSSDDGGQLEIEVRKKVEPELLVLTFDDGKHPFVGTWTYELIPVHEGTLLTITEDGEVTDPFYRFLARFLFRDALSLERYVARTQRALES